MKISFNLVIGFLYPLLSLTSNILSKLSLAFSAVSCGTSIEYWPKEYLAIGGSVFFYNHSIPA